MPIFSIITPSHNQLEWLRLCIASVCSQALPSSPRDSLACEGQSLLQQSRPSTLSLEHIIQDAGTPGIEDLARELGAEFHRNGQLIFEANPSVARPLESSGYPTGVNSQPPCPVESLGPWTRPLDSKLGRVPMPQASAIDRHVSLKIFSEPDAGMYDAINKGLLKSSGKICSWLNCDEQYLPGALEHIQEAFNASPTGDAFFGDFVLIDQDNHPLCYRRGFTQDPEILFFSSLNIASCTLFFRRSIIDSGFLFDPEWKIIGDKVWIFKLLQAGFRFHATRKLVACFRLLTSNLSHKPLAVAEENKFREQHKKTSQAHQIAGKIRQFANKFLSGCYLPRRVDFNILSANGKLVRIGPKWVGFRWPKLT